MASKCFVGGLTAALLFLASPISAQVAQVGFGTLTNTTTSYPAPYGNFWWGARQQYVIPASELVAAGMLPGLISSLAFDVTNTNSSPALINWSVSIGHTMAVDASAWEVGLTVVETQASYLPVVGWNIHNFTASPFAWDGIQNLVVETCFNNGSFIVNASVNQSATTYISTRLYRADAAGVCMNSGLTSTHLQRPNIQFGVPALLPGDYQPNTVSASILINNTQGTPYAATIVTQTAPATGVMTLTSPLFGTPYDVAVSPFGVVPGSAGGMVLSGGQIINVSFSGVTFMNGFFGAVWPGLGFPIGTSGTFIIAYSAPIGPIVASVQGVWVNPLAPNGISLTQATQLVIN